MRFIILLVAGAFATDSCWNAAGAAPADSCVTDADTATPIACTATNCPLTEDTDVPRQWGAAWDAAAEATRLFCSTGALVATDNCDYCKAGLECAADVWAAGVTAAAADGYTPPADCAAALAAQTAAGAAQASCVANASWAAANVYTCADDAGAANTLAAPADADMVWGPTGTTCTKVIFEKCMGRASCADFTYTGTFVAATTAAPSGGDTSDTSPAAMISAGIALLALLF